LLTAPWNIDILSDAFVSAPILLESIYFSVLQSDEMMNYWKRDSVSFAGFDMSPSAALLSQAAYLVLLNSCVAPVEEMVVREVLLRYFPNMSSFVSGALFGLAHVPNVFFRPDWDRNITPWIQTAIQASTAALAGWYMAELTIKNNYSIEKSVGYHFWHNVTSGIIAFMVANGNKPQGTAIPNQVSAGRNKTNDQPRVILLHEDKAAVMIQISL